jgi:hypothetical protein
MEVGIERRVQECKRYCNAEQYCASLFHYFIV